MSGHAKRHQDTPVRRSCALHTADSDLDDPVTAPSDPLRLLLVEPDPAMQTMLSVILAAHYQVETVANGWAASEAAKIHPPALVLIDLYKPGTDSLTLIRAMRTEARTEMVPIIVLTSSTHKELLLGCLTAGASNFLLKPFTVTELLMCAQVELQLRSSHTDPRQ